MEDLDAERKKIRMIRRVGFTFFFSFLIALTTPMLIGAIRGSNSGEIWDPYTGEHLSAMQTRERDCVEDARVLLVDAGRLNKLERKWEERQRQWVSKCRDGHSELYRAILDTRAELLRPAEKKKEGT